MFYSLFAVLTGLLIADSVTAELAAVYAGCLASSTGYPAGAKRYAGIDMTQADCDAACTAGGHRFSYFYPEYSECYGSDTGPAAGTLVTGIGLQAPNLCANSQIRANKLASSYRFNICMGTMMFYDVNNNSPLWQGSVAGLYECFVECDTRIPSRLLVTLGFYPGGDPKGSTNSPWCACTTTSSGNNVHDPCGPNNVYRYDLYRTGPGPSWAVKRASRRDAAADAICPRPQRACALPSGGFECVDTTQELESCGGCRYGVYVNTTSGAAVSATTTAPIAASTEAAMPGVDCSSLPGVPIGSVYCVKGECGATACLPGWNLVLGQCLENEEDV